MKNISGKADYAGLMNGGFDSTNVEQKKEIVDEKEILKQQKEIAKDLMEALEKAKGLYEMKPAKSHHDLIIDISQALGVMKKLS